jgi:citrate synthase
MENFLYMMDKNPSDSNYKPHPKIVKALEILFILHAEHELNCSTAAIRHMTSSQSDVYTSLAGAVTALYGPRHGGANEAVLRMLDSIGHVDNIPQFIKDVKDRKKTLMGFGHRVYKNFDPRATIVRKIADDVFSIVGREPMIDIAMELERIALNDEFFIKRKLYPNVDFYSGVIYKALGIPTEMFTILFTLPRLAGWLAHWNEFVEDPDNKIVRPRQIYKGYKTRNFVPENERKQLVDQELTYEVAYTDIRREASLNNSN